MATEDRIEKLKTAMMEYEHAFRRFGQTIEAPRDERCQSDRQELERAAEAWVELVDAMDKLRDAFGLSGEWKPTADGGLQWTYRWKDEVN